ncbi:hypothetical protein F4818DRAFT_415725 [Hypoxylon cercidicola]|nr:hypothetical protein F4818DRAFT_415725 [Hypoxylon cercidicola]
MALDLGKQLDVRMSRSLTPHSSLLIPNCCSRWRGADADADPLSPLFSIDFLSRWLLEAEPTSSGAPFIKSQKATLTSSLSVSYISIISIPPLRLEGTTHPFVCTSPPTPNRSNIDENIDYWLQQHQTGPDYANPRLGYSHAHCMLLVILPSIRATTVKFSLCGQTWTCRLYPLIELPCSLSFFFGALVSCRFLSDLSPCPFFVGSRLSRAAVCQKNASASC